MSGLRALVVVLFVAGLTIHGPTVWWEAVLWLAMLLGLYWTLWEHSWHRILVLDVVQGLQSLLRHRGYCAQCLPDGRVCMGPRFHLGPCGPEWEEIKGKTVACRNEQHGECTYRHGRCPACGERIRAGEDEIVRTRDGRYVHSGECAEEWEG